MDQPFVWLVRELKFSRFRGHIRALGGCILCLGCVDTAWAAISNQKGRGDSSWLAHLRVHMGEQQHLCTPLTSEYQTQHRDWRCSAFTKAHADQAAIPYLLWESFNTGPHYFPILITVRFTSCWVSDARSRQAYIETVFFVTHLYHLSSLFFFFCLFAMTSAGF